MNHRQRLPKHKDTRPAGRYPLDSAGAANFTRHVAGECGDTGMCLYCADTELSPVSGPVAPDLSSRPVGEQIRVALALSFGAKWYHDDGGGWFLHQDGGALAAYDNGTPPWPIRPQNWRLPKYLTDIDMWAPMMVRELGGYDTQTGGLVRCWWYTDAPDFLHRNFGPWASDLPRAVAAAVLAKRRAPATEPRW